MTLWTFNDGGRAAAGYRGKAGDCVVRSIAIAADLPYAAVYDALAAEMDLYASSSRSRLARAMAGDRRHCSPRNGVPSTIYRQFLDRLGWSWTPTMRIGSGTTVHLAADELPSGRLIVRCSRHLTAVIDGVIHDTHDPSRGGSRAVYGYWSRG